MPLAWLVSRARYTIPLFAFSLGCGGGCSSETKASSAATGAGGSTANSTEANGSTTGNGFATGAGGAGGAPCENLECQQVKCDPGVTTTVTGTVYDPGGTLPLYDVVVYVPNATVEPVPDGLTCDQCGAQLSGSPLVSTITDTKGHFTLENVPVGNDIPIVLQVGKWRRQITIPTVAQCVENPLTDVDKTRLPKSSAEGNLPKIALTTGSSDPLFCLLKRIGIDDSEFGIQGSAARIQFYQGANGSNKFDDGFGASPGANFTQATETLWENGWQDYDIVMLSCEGSEIPEAKDGHRVGLRDYLNLGGRAFATHYHYNWMQGDAPDDLKSIATFSPNQNAFDGPVDIDTGFPKGMALADWLEFVDGSSPHGQFSVVDGRRHTQTTSADARIWVRRTPDPIYFSFNAPIGLPDDQQCGRMVFSDIHVSAGAGDPNGSFPSTCSNNPLSEQEKALIFMLFDLSSCIIPDDKPPCPPGLESCTGAGDPTCNGTCIDQCCHVVPQ